MSGRREDVHDARSFCDAVASGDIHLARESLDGGVDPNRADAQGRLPLHVAARCGHAAMIVLLIQGGADPNRADADGNTALQRAAAAGQTEAVAALLKNGARP